MRLHLRHLIVIASVFLASAMLFEGVHRVRLAEALPPYTDVKRANELRTASPPKWTSREEVDAFTRQWHRDMHAIRTRKWPLFDQGRSLLTLGLSILACIVAFRLWRPGAVFALQTPSRTRLIGLFMGTYLAVVPVDWINIGEIFDREYAPWWADSIGLPMGAILINVLWTLPILAGALWLTIRRAALPVSLWAWDRSRPVRSFTVTCLAAAALSILLFAVTDEIVSGGFFLRMPLIFILGYVVLSARAALLVPGRRVQAERR